jgi:hypothetical protein
MTRLELKQILRSADENRSARDDTAKRMIPKAKAELKVKQIVCSADESTLR